MLRRWLPELLAAAGHSTSAALFRELPKLGRVEDLSDRYHLSRSVAVLRRVQQELVESCRDEWAFAATNGRRAQPDHRSGRVIRSTFFPHLNEISDHVAALVPYAQVGELLRSCVGLTIYLIVIRLDNDHGDREHDRLVPPVLVDTYRIALRDLLRGESPSEKALSRE